MLLNKFLTEQAYKQRSKDIISQTEVTRTIHWCILTLVCNDSAQRMRCAETCVPEGHLREQSAERTSRSGWALRGSAAVHGLTAPAKVPPTWGEIERTGHSFPCDWPSWARKPALPTVQHTLVTVDEIACTHMKASPPTSPACMQTEQAPQDSLKIRGYALHTASHHKACNCNARHGLVC
jgi:hypothetical protein